MQSTKMRVIACLVYSATGRHYKTTLATHLSEMDRCMVKDGLVFLYHYHGTVSDVKEALACGIHPMMWLDENCEMIQDAIDA